MLQHLNNVEHPALYCVMRLGKTIVVVRHIVKTNQYERILIIGPISTFSSWEEEVLHQDNKKILPYFGGSKERGKLFNDLISYKWVFANIETYLVSPQINTLKWDCVVFDESVKLKGAAKNIEKYNNKKPNISKYYCSSFRDAKKRILLSGFPAPHSELDYYQQLKFLDHKLVLPYNTYWDCENKCFTSYGFKKVITKTGKKYFTERLKECALFLNKKDVGFITNIHETKIEIIPNGAYKEEICKLKDTWMFQDEVIDQAMIVYQKMQFLSSGYNGDSVTYKNKYNELLRLLKNEMKNEKVLILCEFHYEIDFLTNNLPLSMKRVCIDGRTKKINRAVMVNEFKHSKDIMIATSECIKYGMNLSFCDTVIFYSLPDNPDTFFQVKERIISKSNYLGHIVYLLVKFTFDEQILKRLKQKKSKYTIFSEVVKHEQNF